MAPADAWELLKHAAEAHGNKLAYVNPVEQVGVTYAALLQQSSQLAAWLSSHGVRRGDRIAVMMHNSIEVIQLHYAAAALHAVVVNMNTHWVDREVDLVFQDSTPSVVFTHPQHLAIISTAIQKSQTLSGAPQSPSCSVKTIVLVDSAISSSSRADLHCNIDCLSYATIMAGNAVFQAEWDLPDSDGYQMYYTSGTTGRPKGVVLSHRIVVTHALGTIKGNAKLGSLAVILRLMSKKSELCLLHAWCLQWHRSQSVLHYGCYHQ